MRVSKLLASIFFDRQQNCKAILLGNYKKGVLPPTEKLTLSIFPTPAWRVKSGLIRRFGLKTQWVRTLSTHAIAFSIQSHRLKPNLTRLDRNSLRSFRKLLKKGLCPFRRLASPISPIPVKQRIRLLISESFVFLILVQN